MEVVAVDDSADDSADDADKVVLVVRGVAEPYSVRPQNMEERTKCLAPLTSTTVESYYAAAHYHHNLIFRHTHHHYHHLITLYHTTIIT